MDILYLIIAIILLVFYLLVFVYKADYPWVQQIRIYWNKFSGHISFISAISSFVFASIPDSFNTILSFFSPS